MYHPLQGVGRSRGAPGHARHARLGALCYSRAPRPPRSSPRRSSSTRSGPTITTTSGGLAYRGDGKLEQAIASFEKALAIYPRHAWSYAQWGATLADIDHRDKGAVAEDTVRIVAEARSRARAQARRPEPAQPAQDLRPSLLAPGMVRAAARRRSPCPRDLTAAAQRLACPGRARASARRAGTLHFARWRPDWLAGHIGLEPANPSASYLIRFT
jgi:tetratricopeptide (TPR) repeat protein